MRLLRKINRGILLTVVIILGIVGYYVVDYVKTAEDRKQISQTLQGFYDVLELSIIVPDEYTKEGITEEQVKPLIDEIKDDFKPYFATDENLNYFIDNVIKNHIYSQTVTPYSLVNKYSCDFEKLKSVRVNQRKNTASVVSDAKVAATTTQYDLQVDENGKTTRSNQRSYSNGPYNMEFNFSFAQKDDKWLISSMNNHFWI